MINRNKNGFIGATLMIVYAVFIIIILALLIWMGFAISDGLVAVFSFLKKWWIAISISIGLFVFRVQVKATINFILNKFGIKV